MMFNIDRPTNEFAFMCFELNILITIKLDTVFLNVVDLPVMHDNLIYQMVDEY